MLMAKLTDRIGKYLNHRPTGHEMQPFEKTNDIDEDRRKFLELCNILQEAFARHPLSNAIIFKNNVKSVNKKFHIKQVPQQQ